MSRRGIVLDEDLLDIFFVGADPGNLIFVGEDPVILSCYMKRMGKGVRH